MEKIKINLSYLTYSTIINDAEAFNIYKANGEINKNEIFNRIVANLAMEQIKKRIDKKNKYRELLLNYKVDEKYLNELIDNLQSIELDKFKREEAYDQIVMIRPTKLYEDIFNEIIYNYLDNNSISSYFRNLFDYYASLNQDEREQIIFKKQLDKINSSIKNNINIKVKMGSSIVDFNVYKVVTTKEKLFNYVLGVIETNKNKRKTITLHLNKIGEIVTSTKLSSFTSDEIKMLNNMIEKGAQFAAGEYLYAKIELTNYGKKKFRNIFLNRPTLYKQVGNVYYFHSSRTQLFQYFSRFGNDAYILSPKILRNDLLEYYKDGYEYYSERIEEE